ncbi:hypothetical protein [Amycolatopsis sacchari]|uniref:hypothetical protein n=1 Tax=Amycolatopsis sacchari TaxID=115433 RepID=UPI003EBB7995
MDEVTIVDRVQVDLDDLGKLDNHIAIPPPEPLEVVYADTAGATTHVKRVFGFTADGEALILPESGTRLTPAWDLRKAGIHRRLRRVSTEPSYKPVGPFTPAPKGLTAVFEDGRRCPIVYYDARGRSLCISSSEARNLYVVEEDDEFVSVEGEPE